MSTSKNCTGGGDSKSFPRVTAATTRRCPYNFWNNHWFFRDVDLKRTRFAGMDDCTVMAGEHNGLKSRIGKVVPHFIYLHCRNHHLALCFTHLIPQFKQFENFDGLLLNLYLLLKNSNVKQSIFEEIQQAYNLSSFKLIKAAFTRWLSHGQAGQWVLDQYETLVAPLMQFICANENQQY